MLMKKNSKYLITCSLTMICEKINLNLSCKILKYMCKKCSEISNIYMKELIC